MARTVVIELLEQKIVKAQSDVVKTKQLYETSISKLGELMDKRDALKRDALVMAMVEDADGAAEMKGMGMKEMEMRRMKRLEMKELEMTATEMKVISITFISM